MRRVLCVVPVLALLRRDGLWRRWLGHHEVDVPFFPGNRIEGDVCLPAGNAWVTAMHSYYRSLPANRASGC